eukprot:m51a1_g5978 putative dna glycosylase (193) ;mRNA; f:243614-244192
MAAYSRAHLEACRDKLLPDILPEGPLRLLFVGINPGLYSTAAEAPFARPGNRFWPALSRAGITSSTVDASRGLPPEVSTELSAKGIGFTNVAKRTTAKASELSKEELREGAEALKRLVSKHKPAVVAVLGISTYRTAFGLPKAAKGRQQEHESPFEGTATYVLGNPSGLNAHETVSSLADEYAEAAREAGVI